MTLTTALLVLTAVVLCANAAVIVYTLTIQQKTERLRKETRNET